MITLSAAKAIAACAFLLLSFAGQAQDKLSCADLHTGIFHFYPKNSCVHLYCLRQGDLQYENDDRTTDTTVWQVSWTGDCTYTEKYISGSSTADAKTLAFLKKHILAYKIVSVTDDYYIAKEYLDKPSGLSIETDTMWYHEKLNPAGNGLFERLSNAAYCNRVLATPPGMPSCMCTGRGNYPILWPIIPSIWEMGYFALPGIILAIYLKY